MSLKKNKDGSNMYPWITHMHSHLGGECGHKCIYCYVNNKKNGRDPKYCGEIRLIEEELSVNYGEGKTIFIEYMNDLFAEEVPDSFIRRIIAHCLMFPKNTYMFQTKNVERYMDWFMFFPDNSILGTTVETNRVIDGISKAPAPLDRMYWMQKIPEAFKRFITLEPILDFDVDILGASISSVKPDFINLGADSKNNNLPEPTVEKVMKLVDFLHENGIELREKHNLSRLMEK